MIDYSSENDKGESENSIGKAKGGHARAESLTREQRKQIARKAALTRWSGKLPVASNEGEFPIGDAVISCAVLKGGKRIITQSAFLRAMGRARSPKAGTGVLSTVDELPFFLQAEALKPFITDDLRESTKPIFYITRSGGNGVGYDAQLLTKTCEVYLRLRDASIANSGSVPKRYAHIIKACDIVMRGLAGVGIIALVDEATGYQDERPANDLARILQAFIAKELQPYIPTFPTDFYKELFRLRGLDYRTATVQRPQYFGTLTNDIVYKRLAPGVLAELKKVAERNEAGRPKHKYFQRLTTNRGYPKLNSHLGGVVAIMKLSRDYHDFMHKLDAIYPKYGDNFNFGFDYDHQDDSGKGI